MSAYLCDFYHISALAVAIHQKLRFTDQQKVEDIADRLYAENCKSVAFRYPEGSIPEEFVIEPEPFVFDRRAYRYTTRHSTVELIKAIHCFEYQACKHPGWEQGLVHYWLRDLQSHLMRELPGYEDAAWGLREPRIRALA